MKPLRLALKYMDIFYHEEDPELLRDLFSENLLFEGPLYQFSSAEDYIESLKQERPSGMDYRILKSYTDIESVCLIYEFTRQGISTVMAQTFDIRDGRISHIRLVFDTAALESHEVVLASHEDELGNDDVFRQKLFAEFRRVNSRSYRPLNEATLSRIPGVYEAGYLGINNEDPGSWEDIELKVDGSVAPGNHISHWAYRTDSIIAMDYPYDAMPEFHLQAGVERQLHYVFVEDNGESLIITNSDGSVKSLYERQR